MSTATATATETQKFETKSLADAARFSELKGLGWDINEDEKAGTFTAHEKAGDLRTIGPASSIKALHTQVMLAAGTPEPKGNGKAGKTIKVDSAKSGSQPILTGTEDAVFADMDALGVAYRKTTMEILRLQKIQKTQYDSLKEMMDKFRDELQAVRTEDGAEERFFTVNVEGDTIDIVLAKEEKEVVKTRKSNG